MARFSLLVFLVFATCLMAMTDAWGFSFHSRKKYERVLGGMTNGEIFRALDKSRDGFLTLGEWIEDSGQEKDFKQMVDHVDENNDGKISLAEFETIKNLKVAP